MSKLQRSSVSFRRQGSSGRIWDDPLRGLDLKGLSSTTTQKAAPLHPDDASVLAGDPSPRVVSRSLVRHGGGGGASSAGAIVESPEVVASASPADAASVVVIRADGERQEERPARLRRRISSAFCACMGHPPASHAQQ